LESRIAEYMAKRPEGDVLRVLGMFGGALWLSEIEDEVRSMNSSLNEETTGDVRKAVNNLAREGIVTVERRERSDLSGKTIKDHLVRLCEWREVVVILARDEKFRKYNALRSSLYKAYG